ncbi:MULTISPECIES: radical SAM protein [Pelosinus]|uniref:Radical SAM domain protein n=1 Tax=Pelosinus fermentans B4 TaxID=1149862 RepID=I8RLQ4_9FIRM|nr:MULTISPECIES: radical SAM protein [Pelosinus]EIW19585.1 Radical SAM domain protein [Pelosinus fermentans B4]EIW24682.1 Radical SAM domain protein [Pelosinus fermentans A11]OAM96038.1 Radical SAM domain protein [Pelosinus fermentans DSM 17108]SDR35647.1 Radical SAM superfamily enzyme, MoaA/NifB/PqqE/SkfB family [Pelosinus fermentans]
MSYQLVDLKVGFTCNNNCIHCVVSDKRNEKDLSLEAIKKIIEDYIDQYNQINLTLTGGEITYREDYRQIMQFIKEKKNRGSIDFVDIQTNGRMLSHDKILEETLSVVDFYLIALHSNNSEIHDYITSCQSSFLETTAALAKLTSMINVKSIAIQTVISKKNYKGLKDVYKFVREQYGILECNITFPHPLGVAYDMEIIPTYHEIKEDVNDALKYCLENDMNPYLEALPYCVFEEKLRIYALEYYKKRNQNVVGYGGEKDGHIDYKIVNEEGYAKYDTCKKCSYDNCCLGVWKEYKQLYPLKDMYSMLSNNL